MALAAAAFTFHDRSDFLLRFQTCTRGRRQEGSAHATAGAATHLQEIDDAEVHGGVHRELRQVGHVRRGGAARRIHVPCHSAPPRPVSSSNLMIAEGAGVTNISSIIIIIVIIIIIIIMIIIIITRQT